MEPVLELKDLMETSVKLWNKEIPQIPYYGLIPYGNSPRNLKKVSYSGQLTADEPIDIIYNREA